MRDKIELEVDAIVDSVLDDLFDRLDDLLDGTDATENKIVHALTLWDLASAYQDWIIENAETNTDAETEAEPKPV